MAEGGVMVIDGEAEKALELSDFQDLLHTLQIHLPEESLTEEIVTTSRNPNLIREALQIKEDLENGKLQVALKPRLACGRVAQVLQLKETKNVQEITRVLFFKTRQCSEKTLKERWEENISRTSCEIRIKRSYQENPTSEVIPNAEEPRTGNDMREIRFQIISSGIIPAYSRREPVIECGFLSGRSDFPVEEDGTSQIERKMIECKVLKNNVRGNLLALPSEVNLKVTHQRYYQTLAYKYILEKVQQPPVRALMVITEHQDNEEDLKHEDGDFYHGTMSEDTNEIEDLNRFCQKEALPCFLAVLNLIFEKVKKRKNEIEPLTRDMYQTLVMGLVETNVPEELRTSILSVITSGEATVLFKGGKFQNALPYPRYEQTEDAIHILQKVLNTPISVEIRITKDSKRQNNEVKGEQNQFDQVDPQNEHQQLSNVQQTQSTDNQIEQQDLKHQQDLNPEPDARSVPGVELQTQQNKNDQKGQEPTHKGLPKEDNIDHKDQKPEEHQKDQKDESEQQEQKNKHHKNKKEKANQKNKKKKQAQKNNRDQKIQKPKEHQSQKTQPEHQNKQNQEEQKDQQDVKVKEHHQDQTGQKKRPKKKHQSFHRDHHQKNKANQQDQQEPEKHQNQEKTQEQHHEQRQEEQRDQQHQKSERHQQQKDQNKQLHQKKKKDQKPDEDQEDQKSRSKRDQKDHRKMKDRKENTNNQQGQREPKEKPSQVPKKKHHAQEKKTDQQLQKPEEDQSKKDQKDKKNQKGQKEKQNARDQQQAEKQQRNQNPEGYQKAQADQENKKEQQDQDDRHKTQDHKNPDKNQQSPRNQNLQRNKSHEQDQKADQHRGEKDQKDHHQVQKDKREEQHQKGRRGQEDPNVTGHHHHRRGNFSYSHVSEDASVIEALDDKCRTEALARFLAVLNLVFEEVD